MKLRKDPILYSQATELIKAELQNEGLDPALYGIHTVVCALEVLQLQQLWVSLSTCSRDRGAGCFWLPGHFKTKLHELEA